MPNRPRDPASIEPRFLQYVEVDAETGCWHWTGSTRANGYGQFSIWPRVIKAHRWAYEHWNGPISDGLVVGHGCHDADETCDGGDDCPHRRCVNPEHLVLQTQGDNLRASAAWWRHVNRRSAAA